MSEQSILPLIRSTLQENRKTSTLRRIIARRLDGMFSIGLSPIERWSDENYAPRLLDFSWESTPASYTIVAGLHGFNANDARVDLCRGHVIILLSHNYDATSGWQQEYYCEVPIPADAKRNRALVEIDGDFLNVTLTKKVNVFKRVTAEVVRVRKAVELLLAASPRRG